MNTNRIRLATAIGLAAAAVVIAGCGSSANTANQHGPPTVGATAQRHLLTAWSNAASRLATVIDHRPFYYREADAVAIAVGQPAYSEYSDILTLP